MNQTGNDTRISNSDTITPPDTITPSGIDQSQPLTNYDDVIWVSKALGTLRTHLAKAKEEGNEEEVNIWTTAIKNNVEDRKNADFDDRYGRHPDETQRSEQICQ
jgi:hypothetical protein